MKYPDEGVVGYRSRFDLYTRYTILLPQSRSNNLINGPGIQADVIHPTSEYIYANDYPGDGWDKLFSGAQFDNGYEICNGSIILDNQLPLFSLYQTYSKWRNLYSNGDFRKYVSCIIGVSYLEMIYRFGSKTVVDKSLSKSVQPLIEGFHLTQLGPRPHAIETNMLDNNFNFDLYEVSVDESIAKKIDEKFMYFGHLGFKYEMARLESNPVDLESPRWWRQIERKSLDISEIVCENQLLLF